MHGIRAGGVGVDRDGGWPVRPPASAPVRTDAAPTVRVGDALALWDDNGNGRITCAEARRDGIAPVPRRPPAYRYMRAAEGVLIFIRRQVEYGTGIVPVYFHLFAPGLM